MAQLSKIINSPVISLATSCIIGKTTDVYFDNKLKNSVYFCIKSDEGSQMLLPVGKADSMSDAIVIKSEADLIPINDADVSDLRIGIMGMPVFTPVGGYKGDISDAVICGNGKVSKWQTVQSEFTPSAIISSGNVILQKGAAKIKQKKTVIPRPEKDYPVYILNDTKKVLEIEKSILDGSVPVYAEAENNFAVGSAADIKSAQTAAAVSANTVLTDTVLTEAANNTSAKSADAVFPGAAFPGAISMQAGNDKEPVLSNGAFEVLLDGSNAYSYDEDAHTPNRVICDYEFLLGRTLGADLMTYTGELIAKKNSVVTDSVVEKARRAGKLVELTLNSIKHTSCD